MNERSIRPVLDRLTDDLKEMSSEDFKKPMASIPGPVLEMTETFKKSWTETMDLLLKEAKEAEARAKDLRERAELMAEAIDRVPKDILDTMIFNNDSRHVAETK